MICSKKSLPEQKFMCDPLVLDNAPVAMLLAILPANFAAQEHDGRQLSAHWRR
jgi:hypothetical protein